MIRTLVLLALLAGCSAHPPSFPACPSPVAVPAPLHAHEPVGVLEIRIELWAEKLLARGNACAAAVTARDAWIERHK